MKWTALATAISMLMAGDLAAAGPTERVHVALPVRVYDGVGVSPAELTSALREAGVVLDAGGLEATWTRCTGRDTRLEDCRRPLGDRELMIQLVEAGRDAADYGPVTMGYALVDPALRRSRLARVYDDRVRLIARAAGVEPAPLLGRAIAHEIGHLLLNTNRHAAAGLMRAGWSTVELRHDAPGDWRFNEDEVRVMHASLVASR